MKQQNEKESLQGIGAIGLKKIHLKLWGSFFLFFLFLVLGMARIETQDSGTQDSPTLPILDEQGNAVSQDKLNDYLDARNAQGKTYMGRFREDFLNPIREWCDKVEDAQGCQEDRQTCWENYCTPRTDTVGCDACQLDFDACMKDMPSGMEKYLDTRFQRGIELCRLAIPVAHEDENWTTNVKVALLAMSALPMISFSASALSDLPEVLKTQYEENHTYQRTADEDIQGIVDEFNSKVSTISRYPSGEITDRYLKAGQEQVPGNRSWDKEIIEKKQIVTERVTAVADTILSLLNKLWWLQGYSRPITLTIDGKSVSFSVETYSTDFVRFEAQGAALPDQTPREDGGHSSWTVLSNQVNILATIEKDFDGLLEGSALGAFPAVHQELDQAVQTLEDGLQAQNSEKIKQGVDQGIKTLSRIKIISENLLKPKFKEIPISVYEDIQLPADPKEALSVLKGARDNFEKFKIALNGDTITNTEGLKHILARQLIDATRRLLRLDHLSIPEDELIAEIYGETLPPVGLYQEMQNAFDIIEAAQVDPKQSQFQVFSRKHGKLINALIRNGGGEIIQPVDKNGRPIKYHLKDIYPRPAMKGEYVPGHAAGESVPIDIRADSIMKLYEQERSSGDVPDHTQTLRFQGEDSKWEEMIEIVRYPDEEEGAPYNFLNRDPTGKVADPTMERAQKEIKDELAAVSSPQPPENQPSTGSQPPPQGKPEPQKQRVKISKWGAGTKTNIISALVVTALLEGIHFVFLDNSKAQNTDQVKEENQRFADKTTQSYSSYNGQLDLKDDQGNTVMPLVIGGDVQTAANLIRQGYRDALTHTSEMSGCGSTSDCAQHMADILVNTFKENDQGD